MTSMYRVQYNRGECDFVANNAITKRRPRAFTSLLYIAIESSHLSFHNSIFPSRFIFSRSSIHIRMYVCVLFNIFMIILYVIYILRKLQNSKISNVTSCVIFFHVDNPIFNVRIRWRIDISNEQSDD